MTETAPDLRAAPTDYRQAALNTLKGSAGNLVEWYDVYTYTVFLKYFESRFFDQADQNSTIYAYAVFAITFLMRPIGSWFFGRFADRRGRRVALTTSVAMMAGCSLIIALTPTRDSIGSWAAVVLILCRLIQGFATGGEYGTSATYMSEAATKDRRGFFSSFQYLTLVGGLLVATFVELILLQFFDRAELVSFGWRIPFAIGGIAAIVVFWLRRTMDESLSDEHIEAAIEGRDRASGSLSELLTTSLKPLIVCFLFTVGGTATFYTYTVNGPAMITKAYSGDAMTATWINLLALVVLLVLHPLLGLLSDHIGRKPLAVTFGVGALGTTYFLVTYLPQIHNVVGSFLLLTLGYAFLCCLTAISAIIKAELFPARVRALGVGLGYGIANSVFGGTAPLVYQWANANKQVPLYIAYVSACVVLSLIAYVVFLKNKAVTPLDEEQGHAYAHQRQFQTT